MIITTWMVIACMVLTSILGSYGMIFLKHGSKNIRKSIRHPIIYYHLFLGLFILGASFIVYMVLLRFEDISTIYPITALNYVWVVILSIKHFNEKMNAWKLTGIFFIMISVILIAIGS